MTIEELQKVTRALFFDSVDRLIFSSDDYDSYQQNSKRRSSPDHRTLHKRIMATPKNFKMALISYCLMVAAIFFCFVYQNYCIAVLIIAIWVFL